MCENFRSKFERRSDEEIIKYAISNDYKIITLDLDFGLLFSRISKSIYF